MSGGEARNLHLLYHLHRVSVRVEAEAPAPSSDFPLILVTGRRLYDRGVLLQRAGRVQNLVPDGYVMIHPIDAEKLGLADGDDGSIVSAHGQLEAKVTVSDGIVPGVALVPCNLGSEPLSVLFASRGVPPHVIMVGGDSVPGSPNRRSL